MITCHPAGSWMLLLSSSPSSCTRFPLAIVAWWESGLVTRDSFDYNKCYITNDESKWNYL